MQQLECFVGYPILRVRTDLSESCRPKTGKPPQHISIITRVSNLQHSRLALQAVLAGSLNTGDELSRALLASA